MGTTCTQFTCPYTSFDGWLVPTCPIVVSVYIHVAPIFSSECFCTYVQVMKRIPSHKMAPIPCYTFKKDFQEIFDLLSFLIVWNVLGGNEMFLPSFLWLAKEWVQIVARGKLLKCQTCTFTQTILAIYSQGLYSNVHAHAHVYVCIVSMA